MLNEYDYLKKKILSSNFKWSRKNFEFLFGRAEKKITKFIHFNMRFNKIPDARTSVMHPKLFSFHLSN